MLDLAEIIECRLESVLSKGKRAESVKCEVGVGQHGDQDRKDHPCYVALPQPVGSLLLQKCALDSFVGLRVVYNFHLHVEKN